MITRSVLANDPVLAVEKSAGALVGLAVGDALGDAARDQELRSRYGILTHLPPGAGSTDDTEFAVLTARALIDCGGELTRDAVARAWRRYVIEQGGVHLRAGKPIYGAVENLRRGILPPRSGIDNVFNDDDGAAMRVAPIGIVCAGEPEVAARMAAIDAEVSHHADGVWAAQAVAASVATAMVDGSIDEVLDAGLRYIPEDSWLGRTMQRAMGICEEAGSVEAAWRALHDELWTPLHAASAEAIPQAYALLRLTRGDFRTGLFWAANFGRDADTIAAIVGAITGARAGLSAIPREWVEAVRRPSGVSLRFAASEDLISLAEQLADLIR